MTSTANSTPGTSSSNALKRTLSTTGRLERDEISYKLEIGHKSRSSAKAVLNNDDALGRSGEEGNQ